MSEDRDITGGPEDDDALAAEYALGVPEAEERRALEARIARDGAFARRVAAWQQRLASLDDAFAPVEPPPAVKTAIDRRLFATPAPAPAPAPARRTAAPARETAAIAALRHSLAAWRIFAAAATAACVFLLAILVYEPAGQTPERALVASLEQQGGDLKFLALYDPRTHVLRVARTAGEAPPERALELWLVAGNEAPVSLGLLNASGNTAAMVARTMVSRVDGATLAVSLEPPGGSPTGAPTGPVVAAGATREL